MNSFRHSPNTVTKALTESTFLKVHPIDAEAEGMRLDRYLRLHCPTITLARLQAAIREGDVRINGKRTENTARLDINDQVRLPPLLRHHWQLVPTKSVAPAHEKGKPPQILYEDHDIIVVNKSAGIACHGGSGISWGLIESLRAHYEQPKMELVHRLDRETSGVLVVARSRQALRPLHAQFRESLVKKKYIAVVHGIWPTEKKLVNDPLYKHENDHRIHKVVVSPQGKKAHTDVCCIATNNTPPSLSCLELTPHTGRTHQLRVHTAHTGHPILGDTRYAHFEKDREAQVKLQLKTFGGNRMYLHAQQLHFTHPITGQAVSFISPIPNAFLQLFPVLKEKALR